MNDKTEYPDWIPSSWTVPDNLHAGISTRLHGQSTGNYASLNLANHVADDHLIVEKNRHILRQRLALPCEPFWLNQVHGNRIINLDTSPKDNIADGVFTTRNDVVCAVMTADCLPILLCNDQGTEIAAVHAGWRGLAAGIIQNAVSMFSSSPQSLNAWLGPAISARNYEVGIETKNALNHLSGILQKDTFIPTRKNHWLLSLYRVATMILKGLGVVHIHGGQYCTFRNADLFFSYRRDCQNTGKTGGSLSDTGRMASLIWMDP